VRYQYFDRPSFERVAAETFGDVARTLDLLERNPDGAKRDRYMRDLVECPQPLKNFLTRQFASASESRQRLMLEAMTRRYYRTREVRHLHAFAADGHPVVRAEFDEEGRRVHVLAAFTPYDDLINAAKSLVPLIDEVPGAGDVVVDLYVWRSGPQQHGGATQEELRDILSMAALPLPARRVVVAISAAGQGLGMAGTQHFTYRPVPGGYQEDELYRGLHPMMAERLRLSRLREFDLRRLASVEDVYLFHGTARDNPTDERLFAVVEVRDVTPVRGEHGQIVQLPYLERKLMEALAGIRSFQAGRSPSKRLHMNRVALYVWPPLHLAQEELHDVICRLAPATVGLGIDEVVAQVKLIGPTGDTRETEVHMSNPAATGTVVLFLPPMHEPLQPLDDYGQRVVQLRRRGLAYPYEIVKMLTPKSDGLVTDFPAGEFSEHDLDDEGRLHPVTRPYGQNSAGLVVGLIRSFTPVYPEGMARVALLGDPSKGLGSLAEAECRRIIAGMDLAEELGVPVEWFALSAGAKIAMDSGTENMDWIARVLGRIVRFTQGGGEINVVVAGINVGAQPYWNAEATMLMHTRGILVMTPESAMVLTGKQALDYSGGVSAEDNQGIGGYERVMGPNGQAQYWAPHIAGACRVLMRHYEHTYVAPGELVPRRVTTTDPVDRDVCVYPHAGSEFALVGDVFSESTNPGRKKPFDIRSVLRAVTDQDRHPLERWAGFRHAESAVVWDAHVGGWPVCLIGLESRPLPRRGFVPADGPDHWTSGTLFPLSSKKVSRAINGASGNRPVVVLANLSGFDGSPESMRTLQLEFGAEIGRAVVNFRGPMVFCVVSRYHGGAFVVFSAALNDQLEVAAVEGSFASVIGGAPAAAVVFAREVDARAESDARVQELRQRVAVADGAEKSRLRAEAAAVYEAARSEALGQVADEFDHVHSVERAMAVGSVHRIVRAAELRPYLVGALDRGIERHLNRARSTP
jgi:acetyl-CoA carboxylase carboxyltransferase component